MTTGLHIHFCIFTVTIIKLLKYQQCFSDCFTNFIAALQVTCQRGTEEYVRYGAISYNVCALLQAFLNPALR